MSGVMLLVADNEPTRVGIRMALCGEADVCAEAENAEQAIRAAKREQPEVCLVGRSIIGDGIRAARGICRAAPNAAVVVVADAIDADDLLDAIRAGAVGYVSADDVHAVGLLRIVRAAADGEAIVPRAMVRRLLEEVRDRGDGLGERERQVLSLLRRGHSTAAIAERLGITPTTVRRHISDLVHKLGVEDRSALTG
jgi:two-component system, NarL family, response regulator LiaR